MQGIATVAIKNRKAVKRTKDLSIDFRLFEVLDASATKAHIRVRGTRRAPGSALEIYPRGIYDLVTQIAREYNNPIIEITECDCCYIDSPNASGHIPDDRRTAFLRGILTELARAIQDGARVRAFHAWSLLDDFEWTDGYSQRYGLTWWTFAIKGASLKTLAVGYARVAATGASKTNSA